MGRWCDQRPGAERNSLDDFQPSTVTHRRPVTTRERGHGSKKLMRFTGEDAKFPVEAFIDHVTSYIRYHGWTDNEAYWEVQVNLLGEALACSRDVKNESWASLEAALKLRFAPAGQDAMYRQQLYALRKNADESLADFKARVQKLGVKAYSGIDDKLAEPLLVDHFIKGVDSRDLKVMSVARQTRTLVAALQLAQELESVTSSGPESKKPVIRQLTPGTSATTDESVDAVHTRFAAMSVGQRDSGNTFRRREQTPGPNVPRRTPESKRSDGEPFRSRDRSQDRRSDYGKRSYRDASRGDGNSRERTNNYRRYSDGPRDKRPFYGRGRGGDGSKDRGRSRERGGSKENSDRSRDRQRSDSRGRYSDHGGDKDRRSVSRDRSSSTGRVETCLRCHGFGHWVKDCGAKVDYARNGKPIKKKGDDQQSARRSLNF